MTIQNLREWWLMNKAAVGSFIMLGSACLIAFTARLVFPEILPVLDGMRIIFYVVLAVTIIAILRNVVGLITYGVFGPAIISLGLTRIGDIYFGLIAFFLILAVGIAAVFILKPLKLQMSHRMAIIVIVVSSTMGFLTFMGSSIGIVSLTYVDLLPILISSWIAERFVRDHSESGWKASFKRLAYTLVAVLATFLLISDKSVMDYFIHTPEMWIVPVALNILIGAKVRVRLSEMFRFRKLAKDNPHGGGYSQVLTVNLRNRDFIEKYNLRKHFPKITKLGVKETLQKAGIPVPRTLATVANFSDLRNLDKILVDISKERGFVIKPNNSFGGRGILVIKHGDGHVCETTNGKCLDSSDIREHLEAAIDGEYSGRWLPDKACIEELLIAHPDLAKLSYSGLPDIRVIVFRGVPVMTMARLPTMKSSGKANLHQGAIGAGIDLTTGQITNAVVAHQKKPITHHPDTGIKLTGQKIPFWDKILGMAIRAQRETRLGYVGVDIVIDKDKGPLVMEVNKRPGLEIQNANRKPLLERLRAVEMFLADKGDISVDEGIRVMRLSETRNWKLTKEDALSFKRETA